MKEANFLFPKWRCGRKEKQTPEGALSKKSTLKPQKPYRFDRLILSSLPNSGFSFLIRQNPCPSWGSGLHAHGQLFVPFVHCVKMWIHIPNLKP